ncbi:MAG: ABC transporter ATP-binding protein [Euryarchaeota archaeon]|nr:ABC transporter ATP-binding protein [Euryarchaeota archaeon]
MRYGETTAIDELSLSVREGEFFTLVGPSGCGKTTLLRAIAGFETPTEGSIEVRGESMEAVPPEDRGLGIVFQNYALFPHMSVAENVGYGLNFAEPPDGSSKEQRIADLLALVDLSGMSTRTPEQLSGGQQQRVAIARALAAGPDVLLLDEPMSALDAQLRERLRLQVKSIQKELEITTVYVTHDQEEALAISDRVAVMSEGTVEQIGSPRAIYDRPQSSFVAEFIGDNNVFSGEVIEAPPSLEHIRVRIGTETISIAPDTSDPAIDRSPSNHSPSNHSTDDSSTNDSSTNDSSTNDRSHTDRSHTDRSHTDLTPGDRVTFCVRPEKLSIDTERNRFEATVKNSEFLGDSTRTTLEWEDRELLIQSPAHLIGRIAVGFDPADAHIVRRELR